MYATIEYFSDNPIIDELINWVPWNRKIVTIRASIPMLRKAFVEVTLNRGKPIVRHFQKQDFAADWAEAEFILATLTEINLIAEFPYQAVNHNDQMAEDIANAKKRVIKESQAIFEAGMYQLFLDQYGENYRDLPATTIEEIATAKKMLAASTDQ